MLTGEEYWATQHLEGQLLEGAVDLHAHSYPEFTLDYRPRMNVVTWLQLAAEAKMGAVVLKSHISPTTDLAYNLRELVKPLKVYGGLSLNWTMGGLNPLACDVAGESGGKIIWMPTWSSANDLGKSRLFLARMQKYLQAIDVEKIQGIRILDDSGRLRPEVEEILEICSWHDMIVASGHLSIEESLVLAQRASDKGLKFLLNHPLTGSVGAPIEAQKQVAQMGGYIEHCFITTMPMHFRLEPQRIIEAILAVGPERCVISTDAIQAWNPPAPEVMRMFIGTLLELGMDEAAIRRMACDNPRQLLGLEDTHSEAPARGEN